MMERSGNGRAIVMVLALAMVTEFQPSGLAWGPHMHRVIAFDEEVLNAAKSAYELPAQGLTKDNGLTSVPSPSGRDQGLVAGRGRGRGEIWRLAGQDALRTPGVAGVRALPKLGEATVYAAWPRPRFQAGTAGRLGGPCSESRRVCRSGGASCPRPR